MSELGVPALFVQGERDKLARPDQICGVVGALGKKAELHTIARADHGFDVLVRSGRQHADVMTELLNTLAEWFGRVASGRR